MHLLTGSEASAIVKEIRPSFHKFLSQYDEKKYPPKVYDQVRRAFSNAGRVGRDDIRSALLWKYGHLGKKNIPPAHERLIDEIAEAWPDLSSRLDRSPALVFDQLQREFGKPKRFVTMSFLVHLLHPDDTPIIDQHNFRAMNHYITKVRTDWPPKEMPQRYEDLARLTAFMSDVSSKWKSLHQASVPNARDLDKFLMMFGKSLKLRKRRKKHL